MSYLFAGKSLDDCLEVLADRGWNARDVADYLVVELPDSIPIDATVDDVIETQGLDIPEDFMGVIEWETVRVFVQEALDAYFALRSEMMEEG
jgi:hypothetical protein